MGQIYVTCKLARSPGAPCKYLMFRFRLIFIALVVRAPTVYVWASAVAEREKFNISIGAERRTQFSLSLSRSRLTHPPRRNFWYQANRAHAPRLRFHWMQRRRPFYIPAGARRERCGCCVPCDAPELLRWSHRPICETSRLGLQKLDANWIIESV